MSKQIKIKDNETGHEFLASESAWKKSYSSTKIKGTKRAKYSKVKAKSSGSGDKPTAKELIDQIEKSEDRSFVESQLEDERKTVREAAEERLEELEGNE